MPQVLQGTCHSSVRSSPNRVLCLIGLSICDNGCESHFCSLIEPIPNSIESRELNVKTCFNLASTSFVEREVRYFHAMQRSITRRYAELVT